MSAPSFLFWFLAAQCRCVSSSFPVCLLCLLLVSVSRVFLFIRISVPWGLEPILMISFSLDYFVFQTRPNSEVLGFELQDLLGAHNSIHMDNSVPFVYQMTPTHSHPPTTLSNHLSSCFYRFFLFLTFIGVESQRYVVFCDLLFSFDVFVVYPYCNMYWCFLHFLFFPGGY